MKFRRSLSVICLAACCLTPWSSALAEPDDPARAEMNPVVVTATRTKHSLGDVSAAVSVVTRKELDQIPAQNVLDVLRTMSGVTVDSDRSSFGSSTYNKVIIRGMGGNTQGRVLVLVDATQVGEHDRAIVRDMAGKKVPKVLAINKIDLLPPEKLLGLIASFADLGYDAIIPISAKTGDGLDDLTKQLSTHLPEGPKYFPDDMMTDQPERQICAEIIREKALLHLREEVPHGIGVEMMAINKLSDNLTEIHATIYCERASHKGIIIGKQGAMLKKISSQARADCERFMGTKVYLQTWVRVKEHWRDSDYLISNFGYSRES